MASDDFSQTPYKYHQCRHDVLLKYGYLLPPPCENHVVETKVLEISHFTGQSHQQNILLYSCISPQQRENVRPNHQTKFHKILTLPAHHDWENLQTITGTSAFYFVFSPPTSSVHCTRPGHPNGSRFRLTRGTGVRTLRPGRAVEGCGLVGKWYHKFGAWRHWSVGRVTSSFHFGVSDSFSFEFWDP